MEVGGRQEVHELDLVVVDDLDVLLLNHGLEQPFHGGGVRNNSTGNP